MQPPDLFISNPFDPNYRAISAVPEFYEEPVEDREASAAAGRAIYKMRERVKIAKVGGNGQTCDELVEHAKTYSALWRDIEPAYNAWKSGQEAPPNGTPLELFAVLPPSVVKLFRFSGLRTIEDLAAIHDNQLPELGLHGSMYRDQARKWLENARTGAADAALAERDRQIADLQSKVAELLAAKEGKHKAA